MRRKVFISYRAAYETYAAWTQRELANKNINAFIYQHYDDEIDSEHITIEKFIYPEIERSEAVIIVLAGNTLDKCIEPDDWVRLEIEKAVELGKKIIPVCISGFSYPTEYPDSLYFLSKLRAVKWNTLHPEQSIANILRLLPPRTFSERLRSSVQKSSAAIGTLRRSVGSAIARTCRFAKTRIFENPVVRKRMKRLVFRPLAVLTVLFLSLFVFPVFVIGPTDWASSGLRNQLADCYEWKILVKRDRDKAYSYFLKSVEADSNAYAMAWVARYLTDCMPNGERYYGPEGNYRITYFKKDGTEDSTQIVRNEAAFEHIRDSLYGVIRHLFIRAGEKGYASAYYDLAQFLQNKSEYLGLSDSLAYAEATHYRFDFPNEYSAYDYKGLWENVVYRIEFQVDERRSKSNNIGYEETKREFERHKDPRYLWEYIEHARLNKSTTKPFADSYVNLSEYYLAHPEKVDSVTLARMIRHVPQLKKTLIKVKKLSATNIFNISGYADLLFDHEAYDAADELYKAGITYDTIYTVDNIKRYGPHPYHLLGHARIALLRGNKKEAREPLCQLVNTAINPITTIPREAAHHLLANYELNDSLKAAYRKLAFPTEYYNTTGHHNSTEVSTYLQKQYDNYYSDLLQASIENKNLSYFGELSTCFSPDDSYDSNRNKSWKYPRDSVNFRLLRQLRKIAWQESNKWKCLRIDTMISRHIVPAWHHGLSFELDYFRGSRDTIGGLNSDLAYDRKRDMLVPGWNFKGHAVNSLYIHYILTDQITQFTELLEEDFPRMSGLLDANKMSLPCFAYYYRWAVEHDSEILLRWLEKKEKYNFENRAWILHNYTDKAEQEFLAEIEMTYGLQ